MESLRGAGAGADGYAPQNAESLIASYLDAGERLRWSGTPKQGAILRDSDRMLIPFSLVWGGFAFFWEASVLVGGAPIFFSIFGIPFVVIGAYMIVGRFFADARGRARTVYGVTDKRVMIVSGAAARRQVKSLALRTLTDLSLTERADGSGTITFGAGNAMTSWMEGFPWPGTTQYRLPQFELIRDAQTVYNTIRAAQQAALTQEMS